MIIDFALIFMFLTSAAQGYVKGFSKMFVSLLTFALTIVLSIAFYTGFADTLAETTDFGIRTSSSIASQVNAVFEEKQDSAIENTPYLSSLSKVTSNREGIIDYTRLSDKIAKTATKVLITVPAVFLIYLCLKTAIRILKRLLGSIASPPVLHGIDGLLGMICGILRGIISVGTVFVILIFVQFVPMLTFVGQQFDSSVIVLLINDFIL